MAPRRCQWQGGSKRYDLRQVRRWQARLREGRLRAGWKSTRESGAASRPFSSYTGSEPILKPGEATEALLKAATANIEKEDKLPTYEARSPKGAYNIADYLWNEAYPKGATPAVALELFAEDIRYEDFNYPKPFLGKAEVKEFVEAFDIPGIEFVPTELSKGDDACCFTWLVRVNGNDGPKGISFYGSDAEGKIDYIRDIPATAPAPLQQLAALVNLALRKF